MKLEDLDLGPRFNARLVRNEPLVPAGARAEVRELTLELLEAGFRFSIGQSVAVLLAGPHDFGQSHHVRLYSIASTPEEGGPARITLCVRRCHYVDPYSGERYRGIASNHLCDLPVGSELVLAGPVGLPFVIPDDPAAPLLMVGLGTGIAPFLALMRHIFEERGGWQGKVRLFHGARTGLESVYRERIADYQSQAPAFEAIEVLSSRPAWDDPADLQAAIARHETEVWQLLEGPAVHVYVAGRTDVAASFEAALARLAGGNEAWQQRKAELLAEDRWMELLY